MEYSPKQPSQDFQEPRRHFLLLSTARSGSSMMMDLLGNHPHIHCLHDDPLNHRTLAMKKITRASRHDLLKYIKECLRENQEPAVIGIKVFLEDFEDTGLCLADILMVMTRPKVIRLYRPNILDTFVSLQIAFVTDQWYATKIPKQTAVEIGWQQFRQYATTLKKSWITTSEELKHLLGPENHVTVTYDELVDNKELWTAKMFRFLNLCETDRKIVQFSVKQNHIDLKSKVSNFEEISKFITTESDLLRLDL